MYPRSHTADRDVVLSRMPLNSTPNSLNFLALVGASNNGLMDLWVVGDKRSPINPSAMKFALGIRRPERPGFRFMPTVFEADRRIDATLQMTQDLVHPGITLFLFILIEHPAHPAARRQVG